MSLFSILNQSNLLPSDGEVLYFPKILNQETADLAFEHCFNQLNWVFDEAIIYGKKIQTKRQIVWMADKTDQTASFKYSGIERQASQWDEKVLQLKQIVEEKVAFKFNSCLLNLYHNRSQGMAWHSDKTKEFGANTTIATLSLGATRRFELKHNQTKQVISIDLEPGSLLVMTKNTQLNWVHRLVKSDSKNIEPQEARISLTFRQLLMI